MYYNRKQEVEEEPQKAEQARNLKSSTSAPPIVCINNLQTSGRKGGKEVQGSHREAEAAGATGATLQRRSEEAHRAALMAEADADLAHGDEGAAAREAERSAAANRVIYLTVDVMQVPALSCHT